MPESQALQKRGENGNSKENFNYYQYKSRTTAERNRMFPDAREHSHMAASDESYFNDIYLDSAESQYKRFLKGERLCRTREEESLKLSEQHHT